MRSTRTPTAPMPSAFYWGLRVPAALRALAPVNLFVRPDALAREECYVSHHCSKAFRQATCTCSTGIGLFHGHAVHGAYCKSSAAGKRSSRGMQEAVSSSLLQGSDRQKYTHVSQRGKHAAENLRMLLGKSRFSVITYSTSNIRQ